MTLPSPTLKTSRKSETEPMTMPATAAGLLGPACPEPTKTGRSCDAAASDGGGDG